MSRGIASGAPPADGGAGGVAGAGVGVCARVAELTNATAQAARVIETIERIISSQLTFLLYCQFVERATLSSNPDRNRIFLQGERDRRFAAAGSRPYSILMPASWITLRQRS